MKAIIPVAGIGKRLRPHTLNIPKALLNVAGKPILGHIVDSLLGMGVKDLIPIVGYKGDLVREYLTATYKVPITFVEQTEQKGIAHAVSLAREYADDSELIIILGDTIIKTDFTRIPKVISIRNSPALMEGKSSTSSKGIIKIKEATNKHTERKMVSIG